MARDEKYPLTAGESRILNAQANKADPEESKNDKVQNLIEDICDDLSDDSEYEEPAHLQAMIDFMKGLNKNAALQKKITED